MELREAIVVLGVGPGASADEVRAAYLELMRRHHPDVGGSEVGVDALSDDARTVITANVTAAYAAVQSAIATSVDLRVPSPEPATTTATADADAAAATVELRRDVIAVEASPATTYALLYDAASRVGHIAYDDRQLGILEIIVRFEGGPSCSVLMMLQQHAHHPQITEIVCSMESIEAAPTPPIGQVIDALVRELTAPETT